MTINFDPSKDYYSVLGLDKAADVEVIKTVFRVLAKRYHPDVCAGDKASAERIFKNLNEAYSVLVDPSVRCAYDAARNTQPGGTEDFSNSGYSYAPEDESSFRDDELDEAWKIALRFYPEIEEMRQSLSKLSGTLGLAFVSVLINSKAFNEASKLQKQIEHDFLGKYFGSDPGVRELGRELILLKRKDLARELNKTVKVLGIPYNASNVALGDRNQFISKFLEIHGFDPDSYFFQGELVLFAQAREAAAAAAAAFATERARDDKFLGYLVGGSIAAFLLVVIIGFFLASEK